ncbi:hypothetical protein HG536_0H02950 [Torulaspora globosa]|uniref:Uncharacterized protein n=1 Tax=Torulaspora globosa TaxID=48254 RepID=A0A7G3ZN34_9SACH|nr:uncharacterized protein HG536_0H02950 [Torulaspora globosa]QLL34920.1 hypothetical protein HG536_0H02950 [Torulaspora globosa]
MAFNSSSTWAGSVGSSSGWSLETSWWPSDSTSGRSTLASRDGGSLMVTSSSGPTIVTPSSSQLYSSSEIDSASLGQVVSSQSPQLSRLWSRSSSAVVPLSTLESSSASGVSSSSTSASESELSSVRSESSSSSGLERSSASSASSSWASRSSSSSPSSSSDSDTSVIDLSTSSSSSESVIPSTSVLEPQSTPFSSSSATSAWTSTSAPSYTVSQDSRSIYYIYTQLYHITGSTTTFDTGLPTTTARAKTVTSSFSVPTSTQTRGIQFYENWLDGGLGEASSPSSPTKNKIIGGVVGGVAGALLCGIVLWLMFFRRRKKTTKAPRGFTSKIGRRAGYPLPSQASDHDQEKVSPPATGSGQTALLSRIKSKAMAQISRNKGETDPRNDSGNPFQDEFNFQARRPPPIPPSRNITGIYASADPEVPVDHRFSYVSSLTDSSYISSTQGNYSSMSSSSIRLAPDAERNPSESARGFLREVI